MFGSVLIVAELLESKTTNCNEEYCLAVQQGIRSNGLRVPLVERIFYKAKFKGLAHKTETQIRVETHQQWAVMRSRLRDTRHGAAGAATEVRIVALRLHYPIVPADVREWYVELLAAAFGDAVGTVNVSLLSRFAATILCVDHYEGSIVLVDRYDLLHALDVARFARDLYEMAELVIAEPAFDRPLNIDFHPLIWSELRRKQVEINLRVAEKLELSIKTLNIIPPIILNDLLLLLLISSQL